MSVRWLLASVAIAVFSCLSFAPGRSPAQAPGGEAETDADVEPADPDKDLTAEERRQRRDEELRLFGLFSDTFEQIRRNYVKDVTERELMEAAIQGMLSKLDPYSNYIAPDELDRFKTGVENEFGGVGILVNVREGGLEILSPLVGTPAYKAGLRAGDRIVEIDGKSTDGFTVEDAVKRMKGEVGTEVAVKITHPGESPRIVTLRREVIRVPSVVGYRRKPTHDWDYYSDPASQIGYIRVTAFSRHTAPELQRVMSELRQNGLRALVLDLRFNPGGLLSSAIEVSDMFVSDGRIVSTEGRNVPKRVWNAHKPGTFEGFPIAVLVNRYSASASEIVSACLQDHRRATVIGERTWGKGSVQNIIELEEGKSALKLTTAGYMRPNGKNIHRLPGASDNDEWGVRPNDGWEVKFSNEELRQLDEHWRRLDILASESTTNDERPPEPDSRPKFVDRQYRKAVEYLTTELAQAPPRAEAK